MISTLRPPNWTQAQLAFFVAGKEATAGWVEEATNSGCLVIDSSGLFALEMWAGE